jgi:hypothetical protein
MLVDGPNGRSVAGVTSGSVGDCTGVAFDTNVAVQAAFVSQNANELTTSACGDVPAVGEEGTQVAFIEGSLAELFAAPVQHTADVPPGTAALRIAINAEMNTNPVIADFPRVRLEARRADDPRDGAQNIRCVDEESGQFSVCSVDSPAPGRWDVTLTRLDGKGHYQMAITTFAGAPIASADEYSAAGVLEVDAADGVLINDEPTTRGDLTAEVVTDVAHGNLALESDGSFTYTPETGYIGQDAFVYRATDGSYEATALVTLIVTEGENTAHGRAGCSTRSGSRSRSSDLGAMAMLAMAFAYCAMRRRGHPALPGSSDRTSSIT